MPKTVVIDPITRIEGHAKISVFLDDAGNVSNARFHVVEYRGFEKFCEGRPYTEMAGDYGPNLRHLPGEPPDLCGKNQRQNFSGEDSPSGG